MLCTSPLIIGASCGQAVTCRTARCRSLLVQSASRILQLPLCCVTYFHSLLPTVPNPHSRPSTRAASSGGRCSPVGSLLCCSTAWFMAAGPATLDNLAPQQPKRVPSGVTRPQCLPSAQEPATSSPRLLPLQAGLLHAAVRQRLRGAVPLGQPPPPDGAPDAGRRHRRSNAAHPARSHRRGHGCAPAVTALGPGLLHAGRSLVWGQSGSAPSLTAHMQRTPSKLCLQSTGTAHSRPCALALIVIPATPAADGQVAVLAGLLRAAGRQATWVPSCL